MVKTHLGLPGETDDDPQPWPPGGPVARYAKPAPVRKNQKRHPERIAVSQSPHYFRAPFLGAANRPIAARYPRT
jgi:hypothetical protein